MNNFDVVIVGGGMTGMATCLALADLGLKVAVVERKAPTPFDVSQSYDLRVSAISLGTEQFLSSLNVWQSILNSRHCPYERLGVWEMEQAYTEFTAQSINETHLGHIVENRLIQLALWQRAEQHQNIKLFVGEEVSSFVPHADNSTLMVGGQVITALMLVAADGANSWLRKQVNIGCTGWNYKQSAMLINVKTSLPQQNITWQQFTPEGPLAMLPLSGKCASLVWYQSKERIKTLSQLSNQELTKEITAQFPERLGKVEVIAKGAFPLTRQHANCYVKQSVVLIGDAAHTINPLAGQGVNLGFKDVKALQQVIASAIAEGECWHSETVLKRYENIRRKDNLLMMSAMDGLYNVFSNDLPLIKGIRNVGLFVANRIPVLKEKALAYACGLN